MKKTISMALIAGLFAFAACKQDSKTEAPKQDGKSAAQPLALPAYEIVNKMTENNGDYVIDIVITEYSASTSVDVISSALASIAKKETAQVVYLYNVKEKKKRKEGDSRPAAGLLGEWDNGKFKKK